MPVPVISAVGHETDVTIADFVADVRAPTPSAAAELVVSRKDEFCGRIDRLHGSAARRGRTRRVQRLSRRVHVVERPAGVRRLPRPRRDAGPPCRGVVARARAAGARRPSPRRDRRLPAARATARDLRPRPPAAGIRTRLVDRRRPVDRARCAGGSDRGAGAAPARRRPARHARARWPCSAAATRCAGTPTGHASLRDAATVAPGDRCASRSRTASWTARCVSTGASDTGRSDKASD